MSEMRTIFPLRDLQSAVNNHYEASQTGQFCEKHLALGRHEAMEKFLSPVSEKNLPKRNKYNFQSQRVSIGGQNSTPNAFDGGDIQERKDSHLVV
jgi:hypothetical protein